MAAMKPPQRALFFFPSSRNINPLSGLGRLNEAIKGQTNYSSTPQKSAFQSKPMELHQVLHLNDTADYKLGSLVSSFGGQ